MNTQTRGLEHYEDGLAKLALAAGLSRLIWQRIRPMAEFFGFALVFGAAWLFFN